MKKFLDDMRADRQRNIGEIRPFEKIFETSRNKNRDMSNILYDPENITI